MEFLLRRYAFRFGNPNLLGAFYPLAYAMVLRGITPLWKKSDMRVKLCLLLALSLPLLPLCHTFSKHAIMTGALLGGWVVGNLNFGGPWPRRAFIAAILLTGLIFETTVIWTGFPLDRKFPFVNTEPGAYSIHQLAYAKMALAKPLEFFTGRSAAELKRLYPDTVDRERAKSILLRYNAMTVYDDYCTFMDPHNEYLNTLSLFGAIGLAAIALFLIATLKNAGDNRWLLCCLLAGLACSFLWDDLFSKRFIWPALALLSQSKGK